MIDRTEAIAIARRLADSVRFVPGREVAEARTNDGTIWVVRFQFSNADVWVDGRTGLARWSWTADEWKHATDPRDMLRAAGGRTNAILMWRFVCVLGRRLWDQLEYEGWRIAIATTERWLEGQASDDALNTAWFDATGGGASLVEAWAIADEILQVYGEAVIPAAEVCDRIRRVLGNPFVAEKGRAGPEGA
jgi:hypothetical protein